MSQDPKNDGYFSDEKKRICCYLYQKEKKIKSSQALTDLQKKSSEQISPRPLNQLHPIQPLSVKGENQPPFSLLYPILWRQQDLHNVYLHFISFSSAHHIPSAQQQRPLQH